MKAVLARESGSDQIRLVDKLNTSCLHSAVYSTPALEIGRLTGDPERSIIIGAFSVLELLDIVNLLSLATINR
jgi:hypothetical protein